jgi:hypothetical protein
MNIRLLLGAIILVLSTSYNYAQNISFKQIPGLAPAPQNIADFNGVFESSVSFIDIDNDNDQDLFITGENSNSQKITELYSNDGSGNYSKNNGTYFIGVSEGSTAFADIDGDNDQDILITGDNGSQRVSKLYINDGLGNFSLQTGNSFDGVYRSSVAFSDIDGDNDQDVLITGRNNSNQRTTKLYINDGIGNFSEAMGTPFVQIDWGSAAFEDIDNDNDQDLMILASDGFQRIAKLYKNNGLGIFTEVIGTPFIGLHGGSISFADIDGDNDQDVLITGNDDMQQYQSILYMNDGIGNFNENLNVTINGVIWSDSKFFDIDNDNDLDLIICGQSSTGKSTNLYENDGTGNFTEKVNTLFDQVERGAIDFADVDNDNDIDLLITGYNLHAQKISKLYMNDGLGNYFEASGSPFEGVYIGSMAFADIDSDNDNDILITGLNNKRKKVANLYSNDGLGNFSLLTGTSIEGVFYSSVAFADVDNDNDQDLLITGYDSTNQRISNLYLNDSIGNFSLNLNTAFDEVADGSIAFTDVNGDTYQDVLITGHNGTQNVAKLYINDGTGNFNLDLNTTFDEVSKGAIAFADIDNDNDQDLLITGIAGSQRIAKLYINDGAGIFTEAIGTPFYGVYFSSVNFVDVDSDNDLDIFITGFDYSNQGSSNLYINDGSGNYSISTNSLITGVYAGSSSFADLDNDNDMDLLITGSSLSLNQDVSKLYTNDGTGYYTEFLGAPFIPINIGMASFVDIDNDSDQDLVIAGNRNRGWTISVNYKKTALLYRNTTNEVGISENPTVELVNLYPNPVQDVLTINSYQVNILEINIIDLTGKVIKSIKQNTNRVKLVDIPNGIYLIKVITDKNTITKKFVKH